MESTSQNIEHSFGSSKVMLTTHAGSMVAVQAKMLGVTAFELDFKPRDGGTAVRGELYIAGASVEGRVVGFLGQEYDLPEKPGWKGRVARKKAYLLMSQFIADIQAATRSGA